MHRFEAEKEEVRKNFASIQALCGGIEGVDIPFLRFEEKLLLCLSGLTLLMKQHDGL